MAIDVSSRGSDGYEANRGAFNVLVSQDPAAIVTPSGASDVVDAIAYAKAEGLRIGAQRTGHSAEPLGDLADTLLVRTAAMSSVSIDAGRRVARVGAGALWGDLVPQASEMGLAACHGSSPTVGIVGYSLGGGVGWYGRKHGLQCNRVTAIELVDATGTERRVDADSDPELFWALRGGGGDFGIVTALEFELLPIAEVFGGALFFPVERASEVLHAWREWTATAPDEVTSLGRIMSFPPLPEMPDPLRGKDFAIVEAVALLPEADAVEVLAPLRDLGGATMDTFALQPPVGLSGLHMDPPEPAPYAGSAMLLGDLPGEAVDSLLAAVGPDSPSKLLSVEVRHDGGAMAQGDPSHGAMDRLPGEFLMFGVGIVPEPAAMAPTKEWLAAMKDAVRPWDAGRYLNFSDEVEDIGIAFPPETVERLRAAKAKYDPENLFHANHPVVSG
ncbi:MAG TPA: FAD-binding oxidoreductase [Solirubrobacterales bacterium]|jgi:FAD/FMN-containing dehydrogenase|nr:FAD-binding oxidoreductase [Solirubrobacterales bacterium]